MTGIMKRIVFLLLVALAGYALTGLHFVQPEELGVVRRGGRALPTPLGPGAHWGWPWPWDRMDRVKPQEVKRVTLGPLNLGGEAIGANDLQLLTGDRNLVHVRASVQYAIHDPVAYLFAAERPEQLIAQAGQAALTETLAGETVDRALTLGRQELAVLLRNALQDRLDVYGLGIVVRSCDIGSVEPPAEVAEAFDGVISAQRQRDQQVHQSQSYANRTRAQAQASAQRKIDQARGDRDRSVRQAEAEAQRFAKLLNEYSRAPRLTVRRLYLETMSETLPRFRSKLIVDDGSDLDLSIIGGRP
jgi:membrane protease subunit HflK